VEVREGDAAAAGFWTVDGAVHAAARTISPTVHLTLIVNKDA
jgi:hypothetical protein